MNQSKMILFKGEIGRKKRENQNINKISLGISCFRELFF